jgi:hypothetical protein
MLEFIRLNFKAVKLHIDSGTVVHNIKSNTRTNLVGKALIDRIRRFIDLEWEVEEHHSYRETNFCVKCVG